MRRHQHHLLYADDHLLAIDKPSGLFTQAAPGVPSLQTELIEDFREVGEDPFVGIVHRLDRPTSGVVVFGRTAGAVRQLNTQFRSRSVSKQYLALVAGRIDDAGHAVDYLRKIDDEARAELCDSETPGARKAMLQWRCLAQTDDASLLAIKLETGRMHQIRLQLAARSHPVLGDEVYGDARSIVDDRSESFAGFGLHAWRLELRHPKTAKRLNFTAPLPAPWRRFSWVMQAAEAASAELSS